MSLDERGEIIAALFDDERSDLFLTKALHTEDRVLGVYLAYPTADKHVVEMMGAMVLLQRCPEAERSRVSAAFREFSSGVPEPLGQGSYLARFTVAASERGTGMAKTLLDHFLRDGGGCGGPYSLHVKDDNIRAIRFYEANGFLLGDADPGKRYRLMAREG